MIYKVKFEPNFTKKFQEEIDLAFSPSLISYDSETETKVFSLDMIKSLLDEKFLISATEQDILEVSKLLDENVFCVELSYDVL